MGRKKPIAADRLIEENQGLVYHLASRIHRRLPVRHEFDDLVGYGMLGLAEAAKSFAPSRGVKFSTFAFFRIRGAIFDGVSEGSWMTRAQYRLNLKRLQAAEESSASNPDDDTEIKWNDTPAEVVALTKEHVEQLADSDEDLSAPAVVSRQETEEILLRAVESLPRRSNRLITMIYFEGLSLQEAADRIGISKSWASRLHARILQNLGLEISRQHKEPILKD